LKNKNKKKQLHYILEHAQTKYQVAGVMGIFFRKSVKQEGKPFE